MVHVNPLRLLLWTFRRSPGDVIDLYNTLSPVMQLATGGRMLNFGYWEGAVDALEAQENLCDLVGEVAELHSARRLVDVGSGLGAPAMRWRSKHGSLDTVCLNINRLQLASQGQLVSSTEPLRVNATSVALPFPSGFADRVVALESAQHFRPLDMFARECRNVLMPGGILVLAIPVAAPGLRGFGKLLRLGILSLTWSSEHYSSEDVITSLASNGFRILEVRSIGHFVYEPLMDYYIKNRVAIRRRILEQYPGFVETILHRSLQKMGSASRSGLIDYVIIKAV